MNDSHFFRAAQPPDVTSLTHTLFDTNLSSLQSAPDAWDSYRMPESQQEPVQTTEADTGSYVRASMFDSADSAEKKGETSRFLVVGIELAAAAVLVRLGMKHFAKNGARIVAEAESLNSGLATKLSGAAPKSFSPTSIAELQPKTAGITNLHPLPKIRTVERESNGPLRVG